MNDDPERYCSFCGEAAPVRVLDYAGYSPSEWICEACFWNELITWDDLPEQKEEKDT